MSKKPWRKAGMSIPANPQKYKWAHKKTFNNFNDADELRNKLKSDGLIVKIRRCGSLGSNFKVITASEIKTNKKQKGEKDATK